MYDIFSLFSLFVTHFGFLVVLFVQVIIFIFYLFLFSENGFWFDCFLWQVELAVLIPSYYLTKETYQSLNQLREYNSTSYGSMIDKKKKEMASFKRLNAQPHAERGVGEGQRSLCIILAPVWKVRVQHTKKLYPKTNIRGTHIRSWPWASIQLKKLTPESTHPWTGWTSKQYNINNNQNVRHMKRKQMLDVGIQLTSRQQWRFLSDSHL